MERSSHLKHVMMELEQAQLNATLLAMDSSNSTNAQEETSQTHLSVAQFVEMGSEYLRSNVMMETLISLMDVPLVSSIALTTAPIFYFNNPHASSHVIEAFTLTQHMLEQGTSATLFLQMESLQGLKFVMMGTSIQMMAVSTIK
jgi:hypothetical protein